MPGIRCHMHHYTTTRPALLHLQVAVGNTGSIFVADGYCNSRVVRFSAEGSFEAEYRLPSGAMDVPHSLVLDECHDALYVGDRQNSQVHKFSIAHQTLQGQGATVMPEPTACFACVCVLQSSSCAFRCLVPHPVAIDHGI